MKHISVYILYITLIFHNMKFLNFHIAEVTGHHSFKVIPWPRTAAGELLRFSALVAQALASQVTAVGFSSTLDV